jgi:prepilin peptidase CpaA
MSSYHIICIIALLVPLALVIAYTDVRYRRIPNTVVLATMASGLLTNTFFQGVHGLLGSVAGCALAFVLMLLLHIFGAMGAGDVKLFAAVGALLGLHLVLPTFGVVLVTGFIFAVYTMFRERIALETIERVVRFFIGLLPGGVGPRFAAPADRRHTIPYGVAITLGSLISLALFHA